MKTIKNNSQTYFPVDIPMDNSVLNVSILCFSLKDEVTAFLAINKSEELCEPKTATIRQSWLTIRNWRIKPLCSVINFWIVTKKS